MAPQFDLVELFSGEGNVGKVWRPAIQIEIYYMALTCIGELDV